MGTAADDSHRRHAEQVAGLLDALSGYFRYLARAMRLDRWRIHVEVGVCDDRYAEVEVARGRREMTVRICEDFPELDPAEQRRAVLHELAHPHAEPIREALATLERRVGSDAFEILSQTHQQAIERVMDEWAETVAPHVLTYGEWVDAGRPACPPLSPGN